MFMLLIVMAGICMSTNKSKIQKCLSKSKNYNKCT